MPIRYSKTLAGRTVRCILFDFGDTLWTRAEPAVWNRLTETTNQRACTLIQSAFPDKDFPQQDGEPLSKRFRTDLDRYIHATVRQKPGLEPDGPQAVLDVLHHWGLKGADYALGTAIFEALRVRIPESRALFHDTKSTLTELQRRGFILGVVTNRLWGGQPFLEDMYQIGFDAFFDLSNMSISADLRIRKPNPAIFMHALNKLNVAPEEAVMVGDSLRADVGGSQGLNIYSIWKPKPGKRQRELAMAHSPLYRQLNQEYASASASTTLTQDASQGAPDESDKEPLPGDDDLVLANRPYDKYASRGEVPPVPDLTIEYLSDLLGVFTKVGQQ